MKIFLAVVGGLICLAVPVTAIVGLLIAVAQRTGQRDIAKAQAVRAQQDARQARAELIRANAQLISAGVENAQLTLAIESDLDRFLEEWLS